MDNLMSPGLTMTLIHCALAAGTTTTLTSTGTIHYAIKGKTATKSALSNTATPTTDAVTAAAFVGFTKNNGCLLWVGLDAAGNLKIAQGDIQPLDTAGNFILAPRFAAVPDTICPIGYIVCAGGSTLSGTWTPCSSNWNATGMTATFVSCSTLPTRPQVS